MLRLFDAWYTVGGLPLAAEYIFAAATHPAYQGNGYMGMLVGAACAAGAARGAVLSVLVPQNKSLFHYYENLSYHTGFYLRTEQYQPQAGERYPIEQCGFTDFCRLREQMLLQYPKRIEPGSDLWIYSYEDMAGDIYRVAIADEERYLVVRKEQDCLLVRETDCTPQELRILDETLRYTFDVTLIRLFTMGGQEDQPFGMYRILAPGCHDLPQGDAYMNLMLDK